MNIQFLTYRFITFGLIVLFCVFSIGLPIVIASCPMMKAGMRSSCCPMNDTRTQEQGIVNAQPNDCCKTVIAGERNTTEFVQSQFQLCYTPALDFIIAPAFCNNNTTIAVSGLAAIHMQPPSTGDIPIITSSLLI